MDAFLKPMSLAKKLTYLPGEAENQVPMGKYLVTIFMAILGGNIARSHLGPLADKIFAEDALGGHIFTLIMIIEMVVNAGHYQDDFARSGVAALVLYLWFCLAIHMKTDDLLMVLAILVAANILGKIIESPRFQASYGDNEEMIDVLQKLVLLMYAGSLVYTLYGFYIENPNPDKWTTTIWGFTDSTSSGKAEYGSGFLNFTTSEFDS